MDGFCAWEADNAVAVKDDGGGSMGLTRRKFLAEMGSITAGASILTGCGQSATGALKQPNILFFYPDQLRYDFAGLNEQYPVRTPNLDALARRGVGFPRAVTPSPLCAPARACIASGREYDRCGVPDNFSVNYPVEQPTVYRMLRDAGYRVMSCGKFDLRKKAMDWGRDGRHVVGDVNYLDLLGFSDGIDNSGKWDGYNAYIKGNVCPYYAYLDSHNLAQAQIYDFTLRRGHNYDNTDATTLPDDAYVDNWIARNGLDLIRSARPEEPWFLQVNFNGPHPPMDITASMKSRWDGVRFPQPFGCLKYTPETHDAIRGNYAAMIENIDRWLGVYIDELNKRDELDNTVVVFSSDHGEMLGDLDLWSKTLPYQPSVGVPLVMAGPGIRHGVINEGPVTTLDLTATFLDYAGVVAPSDMDSVSMRPQLERNGSGREYVRSGLGTWRMVFDGRYKLITGFDPLESKKQVSPSDRRAVLFDLHDDPHESIDVSADQQRQVNRLRQMLDA